MEYYKNKAVIYEIIKTLKNKEIAILGDKRVRCIIASQYKYLQNNLEKFMFYTTKNNLYYSLANFDWNKLKNELNINCFSFDPETRKEQMRQFNMNANKFITSYDLGIDFDNHEGDKYIDAYNDCKKLKNLFDKYKVEYYLKASGSGFHICVKHNCLPKYIQNETDIMKKCKLIGFLVQDIKIILDLNTIDILQNGSFYEPRRIFKIPYSLDIKTSNVALPLDDFLFNEINTLYKANKTLNYKNVLKNIKIYNRGLLIRKGNKDGFDNLIKEEL